MMKPKINTLSPLRIIDHLKVCFRDARLIILHGQELIITKNKAIPWLKAIKIEF